MRVPLWLDTVSAPKYSTLTHDLSVDVCIVGAGIAGISLAYLLKDTDLKIALIDSDRVLHGTTAYTTAKITAQHDLDYQTIIHHYGEYQAKCYANAQTDAINFIEQTIKDLNIDCDFERKFSAVYTQDQKYVPILEKEFEAYQQLGLDGRLVDELDLPFSIEKALILENQAQFHPLKYLISLLHELQQSSNIEIYENTPAVELKKQEANYLIETATGVKIEAKKVVQTSHFPFYDDLALIFAKVEPSRSYLMACKGSKLMPQGMYISYEEPTRSIRTYQDFLIVGGENHRPGTEDDTIKKYETLERFAQVNFHIEEIAYEWSTQDYKTVDQIPFIGRMQENDEIYVATGFKKWGMTNSTVSALLLHDLILGKENPWESLFNPQRKNIRAQFKNLVFYNSEVAFQLLKGKLQKADELTSLNREEAMVIDTDEGKYGVYKDENDELFVVDITCPHLGCELNFNRAEATWDCPCHGSRFSYKGEIITGPAHHSLSSTKNKIDPNLF